MPFLIPTKALPSQIVTTTANGQSTQLNIRQQDAGLFMDVLLNNSPVVTGVLCENMTVIIRNSYFGYSGDFAWNDTQGTSDPYYTGLGARWQLWYYLPSELPATLA